MKKHAVTAALAAMLLAPAAAAAAKPEPCGPLAVSDPAGDQQLHVPQVGVPTMQEAAPLTDMTGFFLRGDGSRVTGNIVISELSKAVPDEATAIRWTLYYTVGEDAFYARTILRSDGSVEYLYGSDDGATLSQLGTMKGEFHEGKDGIISFVIPAAAGGKVGQRFTVANAIAAYQFQGGLGSSADFMPDDGEFEATVPSCGAAPAAPAPADPAPAPQPAPPSSSPGGDPSPAPATQQSDFRLTVKPTTLRAKKLKRGRAIVFRLNSREPVSGVTATLVKGRKKVGAGKLARLDGSGKLKLKPRGRLKKGTYALVISARRADGSTGSYTARIRIR